MIYVTAMYHEKLIGYRNDYYYYSYKVYVRVNSSKFNFAYESIIYIIYYYGYGNYYYIGKCGKSSHKGKQ